MCIPYSCNNYYTFVWSPWDNSLRHIMLFAYTRTPFTFSLLVVSIIHFSFHIIETESGYLVIPIILCKCMWQINIDPSKLSLIILYFSRPPVLLFLRRNKMYCVNVSACSVNRVHNDCVDTIQLRIHYT